MARNRRHPIFPAGSLLALLVGMVVIPALLSLSVGIVALAVWREGFDIVFGVLVLSFAATAIAGGVAALVFVRRGARLAELEADFVANVSHELRTPLAGIRLVAETFAAGHGDDAGRRSELVSMLTDEVARLEDLVERVLVWRQLDSAPTPLVPVPFDLAGAVQEAVDSIALLPEVRSASIRVDVPDDLPRIPGDRALMIQALRNLIHNAARFGGADGPIEVSARRSGDMVSVSVRDHGPGVAAHEQRHIFERFYRATAHRTTRRGTGLGLAIAKGIVDAHHGRLQVASAPGGGAVFTAELPTPRPKASRVRP